MAKIRGKNLSFYRFLGNFEQFWKENIFSPKKISKHLEKFGWNMVVSTWQCCNEALKIFVRRSIFVQYFGQNLRIRRWSIFSLRCNTATWCIVWPKLCVTANTMGCLAWWFESTWLSWCSMLIPPHIEKISCF